MSKLKFFYFTDYEDGKIARVETTGENNIPFNIFIDNAADFADAKEGSCSVDICGIGSEISIFESEEEYRSSNPIMDTISMIPIGTFPANSDDEHFEQNPHVMFTGKVLDVKRNPDSEPNCCILLETLEFTFCLYINYDAPVEKGFIVNGIAWLFGDLEMD